MISSSHVKANFVANREPITRFEKKIQATRARVWGEEEPGPTETSAIEEIAQPAN